MSAARLTVWRAFVRGKELRRAVGVDALNSSHSCAPSSAASKWSPKITYATMLDPDTCNSQGTQNSSVCFKKKLAGISAPTVWREFFFFQSEGNRGVSTQDGMVWDFYSHSVKYESSSFSFPPFRRCHSGSSASISPYSSSVTPTIFTSSPTTSIQHFLTSIQNNNNGNCQLMNSHENWLLNKSQTRPTSLVSSLTGQWQRFPNSQNEKHWQKKRSFLKNPKQIFSFPWENRL